MRNVAKYMYYSVIGVAWSEFVKFIDFIGIYAICTAVLPTVWHGTDPDAGFAPPRMSPSRPGLITSTHRLMRRARDYIALTPTGEEIVARVRPPTFSREIF